MGKGRELSLTAVSLLLAFGAAELVARIAVRGFPGASGPQVIVSGMMESSPDLLWKLRPGEFPSGEVTARINSRAMRGPELEEPKPSGVRRLFFIGDSSIFGVGVAEERTFAFLTAELLEKATGEDYDVVNAAAPGYSSTQCRKVLERELEGKPPDWVVAAPLWSDMMRLPWTDSEMMAKLSSPRARIGFALRRGARKSALLGFLLELSGSRGDPEDHRLVLSTVFDYQRKGKKYKERRVPLGDYEENFRAMIDLARRRGSRVILLTMPHEEDQEGSSRDIEEVVTAYRSIQQRVGAELDVPVIDMPKMFKDYNYSEHPGLFLDGLHPSARGHEIIAGALADFISRTAGLQREAP